MVGQEAAAERLRAYLQELKPGARTLLIAELERGLLRGESPAGAELVLAELRRSLRDAVSGRFDEPARLFFRPLQPFLVDDGLDHKHPGRIARRALAPFWLWITNALMVDESKSYVEQVEVALMAGDTDKAHHQARVFQDRAIRAFTEVVEGPDDKERRRVVVQLGTSRAVDDVRTMRDILSARDRLAMFGAQVPEHITSVSGPAIEKMRTLVESALGGKGDAFVYSLVLLTSRLASPWQLIRLAAKAAGSDQAKVIAETPYAVVINIVLEEVDRRARELAAELKSGRGIAVAALLKEVHDALRGLRSELDLPPESVWGKQVAAIRADISKLLTAEIELMPGRVRRLIRPRPSKEIVPGSGLDPDEVAEVEALIGFVVACRSYASELAINEVTQRTFNDLQQFLDTGTRSLLDALRGSPSSERPFRQSQVEASVRFCAKVFGKEYASLLTKAAEVASHERKVAQA